MREQLKRFFLSPQSARPLAAARVVLGLAMMAEAVLIWRSLDDLFGPYGFLQADLMDVFEGPNLPSLGLWLEQAGFDYSGILHVLFILRWIFLITFTLGYRTRTSAVGLLLFQIFILSSGALSSYGVNRYFHVFLFLMVFMPIGESYSLDRRKRGEAETPTVSARLSLRFLQVALLLTYLNAGVAKAAGTEWWTGDAIWRVLNLPEFTTGNFFWLASVPLIPKILGWGTLFLETFYIVGVWIPRVSALWVLAIVSMHLAIAAYMGLMTFGLTLAFLNLALFWDQLKRSPSLR